MKRMEELPEVDQESYNAAKVHTVSLGWMSSCCFVCHFFRTVMISSIAMLTTWAGDKTQGHPKKPLTTCWSWRKRGKYNIWMQCDWLFRSAKAKKFSRRRMHYEEAEITGISEANEVRWIWWDNIYPVMSLLWQFDFAVNLLTSHTDTISVTTVVSIKRTPSTPVRSRLHLSVVLLFKLWSYFFSRFYFICTVWLTFF